MDSAGPEFFLCPLPAASMLLVALPVMNARRGVARISTNAMQTVGTFMGFTGDFLSSVSGRFGGTAANVSVRQVVSFAPTSASGRTNEMFAAIPARV